MSDNDDLVSRIKQIKIFDSLNDVEIDNLLEFASIENFETDQYVFRENDLGTQIYMIISGEVKITKTSLEGKTYEIARIGEFEFFGEMSFLDPEKKVRSADVQAACPSQLIILNEENFKFFSTRHYNAAFRFLKNITLNIQNRLKTVNEKLVKNYDVLLKSNSVLVENRNILYKLIGFSSDIVIILDSYEKVSVFNIGAENAFKIKSRDILGKSLERVFIDGSYRSFMAEVMATRNVINRSVTLMAFDGRPFPTIFSAFVVAGSDGPASFGGIAIIAQWK